MSFYECNCQYHEKERKKVQKRKNMFCQEKLQYGQYSDDDEVEEKFFLRNKVWSKELRNLLRDSMRSKVYKEKIWCSCSIGYILINI